MVDSIPFNSIMSDIAREAVADLQQKIPGQLEEVWRNDSEKATIYRVREVKSVKGTPLSFR
jgi:hypothetical protein